MAKPAGQMLPSRHAHREEPLLVEWGEILQEIVGAPGVILFPTQRGLSEINSYLSYVGFFSPSFQSPPINRDWKQKILEKAQSKRSRIPSRAW